LLLLLGLCGNPMSLIFLPLKVKEHEFDQQEMVTFKSYCELSLTSWSYCQ
jgi:hypothetical protein